MSESIIQDEKIGEKRKTSEKQQKRSAPYLLNAWKVLTSYAKATESMVCVMDQNLLPIPESFEEITGSNNTCLFCMKYKNRYMAPDSDETIPPWMGQPSRVQDLTANPCNMMHTNAIKRAHHFGGSYIYMCDLGFVFWTSPIFKNGRLSGALLGSGFLGIDNQEAAESMQIMCGGTVPEEKIRAHLSAFPRSDSSKAKSLAEILLICAESLSEGPEDYHKTLRRRAEQQAIISEQISLLKDQYPEGGPVPGYPLDKERMLLAALRRGDHEQGRKILNELLGILFFANPDHFNYIRFRAIELVVLLSRTVISPGNAKSAILEANNHYLNRIGDVENIEELTDVLHSIVEDMAGQIFSFQGTRHASALRKAERYIYETYTRKISLKEVADASGLSAPYFSNIFKEEMGENLTNYLNRLRVEKAGRLLTETDMSLSEIAGVCGFENQSWFSKIFKSFTGVSPGKYRGLGGGIIQEISRDNLSENYRSAVKSD
ncbi:MAG: helix-turn-helix domain-containing protein [Treponema sp.]|jgi:AraC-like DNA-binding protein/ligand-binding sensor protein|nr:helix-turn-helix domain-containing protein [Treponema sp.]